MSIPVKRCALILVVALLVAHCGHQVTQAQKPGQQATKSGEEQLNPLAARLMIRGATAESLNDYASAIAAYQEAALHAPNSTGVQRALGEAYLKVGKIESAQVCLERAARLDPEDVEIHELLANCYTKQRDLDGAEEEYRKILGLEPTNTETFGRLVSIMLVRQKVKDAYQLYKQSSSKLNADVDFLLQVGHLFLQNSAYDEALQIYRDALNKSPDTENPYLAVAAAYKGKKDTTRAIEWYRKALEVGPNFDDAKAELRNIYVAGKRWDEALGLFDELVRRDSTNVENWLELAKIHISKGDTLKAEDIFRETTERFPHQERAHLSLGVTQEALADTNGAIATYVKALGINPDFDRIRRSLRNLYARRGQWQEAVDLYEQLVAEDSTDVVSSLEVADLYYQKGDTALALSHIEQLSNRFPDDWRVPFTAGRMEYFGRNWEVAAQYLQRTVELNEQIPNAWVLLGRTYLMRQELEGAEDVFRKAVKIFENDPELNFYLGSVLSQRGKSKDALPFVLKSLEGDENNVPALVVLAACYTDLGHFERSDEIYERILELDAENPVVLNNYGYSLAVRGIRLEEALGMAQKALDADPENGAYLDTIGWIYYKMGDYNTALEKISKSVEVRSSSAEVMEHLGDVYEKLGDVENAKRSWERALELDAERDHLVQKLEEMTKSGR